MRLLKILSLEKQIKIYEGSIELLRSLIDLRARRGAGRACIEGCLSKKRLLLIPQMN
jgi:hypothetical protein